MQKRLIRNTMALMMMSAVLLSTGCAGNVNININNIPVGSLEVADENDGDNDEQQDTAEEKSYKSENGWEVKYDPSVIAVNEAENMVAFVYTGFSAGTNMLSISYIADKQPEEALAELTEGWGDQDEIERSESYFPGTNDKWGCWRSLISNGEGSGLSENVFAGEYNGGVLMFEFTTHKAEDDKIDTPVNNALQSIMDSITYEDFEPQTMYEYYPGVYKMSETEEIEGEEVTYEYSVTLNEDHSGVISLQDDIYVMWGSNMLIQADNSYEYTIEGDNLLLKWDDNWLSFTKEVQ